MEVDVPLVLEDQQDMGKSTFNMWGTSLTDFSVSRKEDDNSSDKRKNDIRVHQLKTSSLQSILVKIDMLVITYYLVQLNRTEHLHKKTVSIKNSATHI